MSSRLGFALAAALLLLAAGFRLLDITTLPPGLHDGEITDIRVTETVRAGQIEVFYDLGGGQGREPLYHVLLAATTSLIGSGPLGIHLLSFWAGMIALALVYALASRLYGPLAGATALALLALNFWHLLLSREVSRETLLPALLAAVLLMLALALRVHRPGVLASLPPTTPFAALGMLLGVGVYTHPVMLLAALASMVFIAYMLLTRQPLTRRTLGYLGFSILIFIIIAMPYLISSIRLPHLAGAGRLLSDYAADRLSPFKALVDGLAGLFFLGDDNPVRNLPGRPLVDLISGLLMLVGLLTAVRHWRQPRCTLTLIFALLLFPAAFLASGSPNFLAITALLPLLALFAGLGAVTLYQSLAAGARPAAALGLLGLLVFNVIWTGRDFFERWPALPAVYDAYHGRLGQLAHHIDRTSHAIPTLICEPLAAPLNGDITDADLLQILLNRPDAPLRYADCGTGLVLMEGGAGQQIIFPQPNMLDSLHPYLKTWTARGTLLNQPDLPADGVLALAVEAELADKVGRFITTAPLAFPPEAAALNASTSPAAPPVRFGGNLTLLGYEPPPTNTYLPGGIVTAITYWRADGLLPPDLRLFTHILPDPASIAAQNDTLSVRASALRDRDIFIQVTFVPLPASIPDGVYSLSVGAYQASTQTRLAVYDGDQERGTRLFMGTITVTHSAGG